MLSTVGVFSDQELKRLDALAGVTSALTQQVLHKFLIDLSWSSSRLEGNAYDYLDTQILIEDGLCAAKRFTEAKMIVCHKNAIAEIQQGLPLSSELIRQVHRRLADREEPFIGPELDSLVSRAHLLHPINASYYLLTRLSGLQPFSHGIRSTSRVAANIPLIANGYFPISFKNVDRVEYVSAISAFNEHGDDQPMKRVFVKAYIESLMINRAVPLELSVAYSHSKTLITQHLIEYVSTGESSPTVRQLFKKSGGVVE